MAVTISGVTCLELVEGLEETIEEGGPRATKKYLCSWDLRYQLANAFLGLVTPASKVGGSFTLRRPISYPESANLWARSVRIKGVGMPSQGPVQLQFPYAVVTVEYGVPQWMPGTQQSIDPTNPFVFAEQNIDFGGSWHTLPASSVKLANGHKLNQEFAFFVPVVTMSITLHNCSFLPAALIITASQNPLNNATYLGCPAGTLRFDGAKTKMTAASDGTQTQQVTYQFAYRPIAPWDQSFDPDGTSGWQQVQDNTGTAIIGRSDLSTLIPASYL